jgi:hypothetical protein
MKNILLLLLPVFSFHCTAQILLSGYKCLYYENQIPNTMAEFYKNNDTFRFTLYSRDIMDEIEDNVNDPEKELNIGLSDCFGNVPYFKTRDSLYIATGRYRSTKSFYYDIYIPDKQVSLSLRSNKNDTTFTNLSKWLLLQARSKRKKDKYFINERNQTCQNPDEDEH